MKKIIYILLVMLCQNLFAQGEYNETDDCGCETTGCLDGLVGNNGEPIGLETAVVTTSYNSNSTGSYAMAGSGVFFNPISDDSDDGYSLGFGSSFDSGSGSGSGSSNSNNSNETFEDLVFRMYFLAVDNDNDGVPGHYNTVMSSKILGYPYTKFSSTNLDCDDSNPSVTKKNSCDECKKESECIKQEYYTDGDNDGYHLNGSNITELSESDNTTGYVLVSETNGEDCDDTNPHKNKLVNGICFDECDFARAAKDVYDTEGNLKKVNYSDVTPFKNGVGNGWNLAKKNDIEINDSRFKYADSSIGFNSALYSRDTDGDNKADQFMYVTEGTTGSLIGPDWRNNVLQAFGDSAQYEQSIMNARILHDLVINKGGTLLFSGHSLGGGLAAANAMATGDYAYTYNAAGVGLITQIENELDRSLESNINAVVNEGEILNSILKNVGLDSDGIVQLIQGEDTSAIKFFDDCADIFNNLATESLSNLQIREAYSLESASINSRLQKKYWQLRAHDMLNVLKNMDCDDEE